MRYPPRRGRSAIVMLPASRIRPLSGLIGLLLWTANAFAQTAPPVQRLVFAQQVSAIAAKHEIPGIAVAWIRRGQPTEIAVSGVHDKQSGAAVDRNAIFEAGGLGEPVFAYAVLQLAAQGKFNVGVPLPSLSPLPYARDLDSLAATSGREMLYDPQFNQITALRILSHTSGMPDWARNTHLRLQFPPGQRWSYSNEGLIYLQRVLEHVTGEAAATLLSQAVLRPIGMQRSGFVWQDAYVTARVTGYDRAGAPMEARQYARPAAGSTLYTTIDDYTRFVTLLMDPAPAQQVHESVMSLMLRPVATVDAPSSFFWGLGCGLEKSGDDIFFFDRGADPGYWAFFLASRKSGNALVILANSERGADAMQELVAATLGGDHPALKSSFLTSR